MGGGGYSNTSLWIEEIIFPWDKGALFKAKGQRRRDKYEKRKRYVNTTY